MTDAVRRISGEEIEIVGASRTDSGAHALGQVCDFPCSIPSDRIPIALNRVLPQDVRVRSAIRVSESFSSRFCAIDRLYRYRITMAEDDPFHLRTSHFHWEPLNLGKMQQAARYLVGRHDFKAFTESLHPTVENTVRHLFAVEVAQRGKDTTIHIRGTAFLRGMMRRMSGALLEVGRGKRDPDEVAELLTERRTNYVWPVVLPAKGLTLLRIRYGRHPKDHRERQSDNEE